MKYRLENNKYELTDETLEWRCHTLYRIKALKDFSDVHKGDLGGWIEKESNLSQDDDCWAYDDAKVYGNAQVYDYAEVYGNARVFDDAYVFDSAKVGGDAHIGGNAWIYGNADIIGDAQIKSIDDYAVFKNFWSSGRYFTWTKSNNMWKVGCFYGTGEELIKKAYKDSDESGKKYEATVNYIKSIFN